MFFRIFAYIKFLFQSKNHHGVHSPFVFDLLTKCIFEKKTPRGFLKWKKYRSELLQNNQFIQVSDFGAGSKVFKSNNRQISKIAKYAGIQSPRALLLMKLVNYFQFKSCLEIGTSLGLGTTALSLGNPKGKIITLEGCQETAKIAGQMFERFGFSNVNLSVGNFKNTLSQNLKGKAFDFIYFDGNHSKDATIQYFEQCLSSIHNDSLFLFDDIHWSKEMELAWEYIQQHPKVRVTIDTFQWGFVFFRKEQQKEHFIIRV